MTRVGAAIVLVVVVAAVFGPTVAPFDPAAQELALRLEGPTGLHWFGLDELGRDIFTRVLYGARISLLVGIVVVGVSATAGIAMGAIAGYFGGRVDEAISRIIDVLLAFPGLLLAIALVAVLGPSLTNVVIALTLIGWVGYARLVRGQVLRAREFEFVQAARALGATTPRILLRHVIPTTLPAVTVQATLGMGAAILNEASLSFLGFGQDSMSWGSMIENGLRKADFPTEWWPVVFPAGALALLVLAFNLLGDGLQDAINPKLKK